MGLFNKTQIDAINRAAEKSKMLMDIPKAKSTKSINAELNRISENVIEYFKGSKAELITDEGQLHDYISECIHAGYVGIDTETTGLDRWKDTIVGASLYYPGGVEVYIPMKHKAPIFESLYKDQLDYEFVGKELSRLNSGKVKGIYANADFDLAMIMKDLKVDLCDSFYWDVILAWRCMKENERHNDLKSLYNKYVLRGKGDPKRFSDFFPVDLFPYCKPSVAKFYAANDAKISYELFAWQLPYVTPSHPKCKKANLQAIASLVWNVEMPLVRVCQNMHRTGMYLDNNTSIELRARYGAEYDKEMSVLRGMVQDVLNNQPFTTFGTKPPFLSGEQFNPTSPPHVKYLLYDLMKLPPVGKGGTGKEVIAEYNLPITKQILKVRSLSVLINTFVDKMPNAVWPDQRIHGQFKQVGADTGRMSSASPNLQNIPSHAVDIRHMFRATPRNKMIIKCDNSDQVTLDLTKYHFVTVRKEHDLRTEVKNLQVGDYVLFQEQGTRSLDHPGHIMMEIVFIDDNLGDPSKRRIQFQSLGGDLDG